MNVPYHFGMKTDNITISAKNDNFGNDHEGSKMPKTVAHSWTAFTKFYMRPWTARHSPVNEM